MSNKGFFYHTLNTSEQDSLKEEYHSYDKEKQEHFEMFEQLDKQELNEIDNNILELQKSYLGKKELIEDNVKSMTNIETDIDNLNSTLEKSQSQWDKIEKDYVSQSVGSSVIPRFLRSVFNYYPPDHPLYSPGFQSSEFGGTEKPSKLRSFMDKTRLSAYSKSKEGQVLAVENMRNNRDLLNLGKNIKELRDEYYRGSFTMTENLKEEFKTDDVVEE